MSLVRVELNLMTGIQIQFKHFQYKFMWRCRYHQSYMQCTPIAVAVCVCNCVRVQSGSHLCAHKRTGCRHTVCRRMNSSRTIRYNQTGSYQMCLCYVGVGICSTVCDRRACSWIGFHIHNDSPTMRTGAISWQCTDLMTICRWRERARERERKKNETNELTFIDFI